MANQSSSLETIRHFLAQKRIAIVGISRDPSSFSASLLKEFCRRGYDMVPVNPAATELYGRDCFAKVQEILPPVAAVLLMTSPEVTESVVSDCAEADVRLVWMHRGAGQGAVSAKAVALCQSHGIEVVAGECPLMFFPDTAAFHRLHGFIRKISGRYPRLARA